MSVRKLPLLEYLVQHNNHNAFTGVGVIACQHLLSTTVDLFLSMKKLGLDLSSTYVLGKAYSSHPQVARKLQKVGANVSSLSFSFDSSKSFDQQYGRYVAQHVQQSLRALKAKGVKRIILLDDGGILIRYCKQRTGSLTIIGAVEQTSSGYTSLKNIKTRFPIINVARSPVKLKYESVMIADEVVSRLMKYIRQVRWLNPRIAILGLGPIGQNIKKKIKPYSSVKTYDFKKHSASRLTNLLHTSNIIIGATGATVLPVTWHNKLLRPVILVSASSSDREFDAVYLRRQVYKKYGIHAHLHFNGIHLINNGFPINFDGQKDNVQPQKIQLTRALLLAACIQAVSEQQAGIVALNRNIERSILQKFLQLQKK